MIGGCEHGFRLIRFEVFDGAYNLLFRERDFLLAPHLEIATRFCNAIRKLVYAIRQIVKQVGNRPLTSPSGNVAPYYKTPRCVGVTPLSAGWVAEKRAGPKPVVRPRDSRFDAGRNRAIRQPKAG